MKAQKLDYSEDTLAELKKLFPGMTNPDFPLNNGLPLKDCLKTRSQFRMPAEEVVKAFEKGKANLVYEYAQRALRCKELLNMLAKS